MTGDNQHAERQGAAATDRERRSETIRQLNDTFRRTMAGGRVLVTAGLNSLGEDTVNTALAKVRAFSEFGKDNDPWNEHDFGAFSVGSRRIFWKIDYYDRTLTRGSDDPTDPDRTMRVLTVMLAEDY